MNLKEDYNIDIPKVAEWLMLINRDYQHWPQHVVEERTELLIQQQIHLLLTSNMIEITNRDWKLEKLMMENGDIVIRFMLIALSSAKIIPITPEQKIQRIKKLKEQMEKFAADDKYDKAIQLRDLINKLENS
jgi:excinuclease UvrABC helicase subunit UvrB